MPAETYASTAYGAVRRIRTPHDHDVLSGRGGGINSHVGNQVFRQWVAERKEDYNLAPNKQEKTHVALEVMDKVRNQNPPGRFLQRDPTVMTGPVWWVEVDEARALAKTSQALREGAPQIRLAHKEELSQRVIKSKRSPGKRKRKSETTPPQEVSEQPAPAVPATPPLRPLVEQKIPTDDYKLAIECLKANVKEAKDQHEKIIEQDKDSQQQQQSWDPTTKKCRYIMEDLSMSTGNDPYETAAIDDLAETPPLLSMPPPPERMEPLSLGSAHKSKGVCHQVSNNSVAPSMKGLPRVHSLALSDFSMSDTNIFDDDGEFINPFEDESNIANKVLRSRQTSTGNKRYPSDYLRNLSSDESINPEPSVDRPWEEEHRRSNPGLTTDENEYDDEFLHGSWETDFGEGMKSILDIVHPDLTSPEMGEKLPTLLFPWRGSGGSSGILSNFNHSNSRRTSVPSSSRGLLYDGRQ